jgi:hypothetical protein
MKTKTFLVTHCVFLGAALLIIGAVVMVPLIGSSLSPREVLGVRGLLALLLGVLSFGRFSR